MFWIWIWMLWIPFEWFEFGFECFESLSNGSTPFRMVRICIWMLWVPFEWFQFTFECFKTVSNGLNLDFDVSNPFQIVWICIQMFRISFEGFTFAFRVCYGVHSVEDAVTSIGSLWLCSLGTSLSATNSPAANCVPQFFLYGAAYLLMYKIRGYFYLHVQCGPCSLLCYHSFWLMRAATASLYSSVLLSGFCMCSSTQPSACCISFAGKSGSD